MGFVKLSMVTLVVSVGAMPFPLRVASVPVKTLMGGLAGHPADTG